MHPDLGGIRLPRRSKRHRPEAKTARRAATAIVLGLFALLTTSAGPAVAGAFSDLAGSWSGGGTVTRRDGNNERLRCLARYDVGRAGEQANLSIRCASDSFKFDLSGYIVNSAGTVSGQWSEPNYNSSGSLDGRVGDGEISAHAIGNTFSALLSVSTRGNRQTVTIRPQETDVTRVSLSFQRR